MYEKNCGWGPEEFASRSGVRAWFKCLAGPDHIYQTQIKKWSTAQESGSSSEGCPFCHGTYVSVTNWLFNYPELCAEFNTKRNDFSPKEICAKSKYPAWWICSVCGNEWQATPCDRVAGHGCFVCNIGEHTDLRQYPKALRMFAKTRNKYVDPYCLLKEAEVWWHCPKAKDHLFKQKFYKLNYPGSPCCPYCNHAVSSSTNNLTLNLQLLAEFHPRKNGTLKPKAVALNSQKPVWWICKVGNDHEWRASPASRSQLQ
ncbi:MAG: zinc-ribbon domain-containing protein, partial [Terriglobales bacterium]